MNQNSTRLGAALLTLGLVALVAVAQAQTDPATSAWTHSAVNGSVVSVDPQAKTVTVRTDAGATHSFVVAESTWMQASGKDITVNELKVGDRVRIEPTPGSGADEPTRIASRLEVMGGASLSGSTGTAQRPVSTDRPVLGEGPDAGGDRPSMPATAGSTTERPVSTDRPVFGQDPNRGSATTGTAGASGSPSTGSTAPGSTTTSRSTTTTTTAPSPTYAQTPTPSPSTPSSSSAAAGADDDDAEAEDVLPATAGPLPLLGLMGLLAIGAGLAVRATRKQRS